MSATCPFCDYVHVLCLEAKFEFRRISFNYACRVLDKLALISTR
jgi:hypothetical protein